MYKRTEPVFSAMRVDLAIVTSSFISKILRNLPVDETVSIGKIEINENTRYLFWVAGLRRDGQTHSLWGLRPQKDSADVVFSFGDSS